MDGAADAVHSAAGAHWDPAVAPAVRALVDDLVPLFYADLKRIAHRERARVRAGDTLQTTALVHEAYLRLRRAGGWNDDAHFLRAAALAMRHALVNHALARRAGKRGGGCVHVSIDSSFDGGARGPTRDEAILALDDALARLAGRSLRMARVVECRFFAGLDEGETATALGVSDRTVRRDWTLARAWLYRELDGDPPGRRPATDLSGSRRAPGETARDATLRGAPDRSPTAATGSRPSG